MRISLARARQLWRADSSPAPLDSGLLAALFGLTAATPCAARATSATPAMARSRCSGTPLAYDGTLNLFSGGTAWDNRAGVLAATSDGVLSFGSALQLADASLLRIGITGSRGRDNRSASGGYSRCGRSEPLALETDMGLMDFIKKQFIDIIQWTEDSDGTLAWRFPMADMEIQYGGSLTVRESQVVVFVNEGKVADVFGPGMHKLTTQTLPVLTYLKNWDKLFESPFKSDIYFFSTRQQVDQRWGTTQPVTIRDKDFGAVRLRGFGNFSYRIADAKVFHTEISGTRERYTVQDLDGQLRGLMLQHISDAVAQSGIPFLDLAANQVEFAKQLQAATAPEFERIGLKLEGVTLQNVSLPEELQKILDQRIGMGMIGQNMGQFMQYQTAQAIPKLAEGVANGGGGVAGDAMGLGAGLAMGQVLAQQLGQGLNTANTANAAANGAPVQSSQDIMALIEKLGELKAKGILTDEEFSAKKAELLKKLS